MDRQEVYEVIDEERDFQESFVKDKFNNPEYPHSVAAELVMINHYVKLANEGWTTKPGDEAALNEIRKIAAMCVRCMENHGAVRRLS